MSNFFSNTFGRLTELVTGATPWYKLPPLLGLPRVFRIRRKMRSDNLHDTGKIDAIETTQFSRVCRRQRRGGAGAARSFFRERARANDQVLNGGSVLLFRGDESRSCQAA